MPLELEKPLSLKIWQEILSAADPDTTFQDYVSTFHRQPATITEELKKILDHFGWGRLVSVFAVRRGVIEGIWVDPFHNYTAIVFSKANGDDDDFVMINSIM